MYALLLGHFQLLFCRACCLIFFLPSLSHLCVAATARRLAAPNAGDVLTHLLCWAVPSVIAPIVLRHQLSCRNATTGRCRRRQTREVDRAVSATRSSKSTSRTALYTATARGSTRVPAPTDHHWQLSRPHPASNSRRHSRVQLRPLQSRTSPTLQSSRRRCPPQQLQQPPLSSATRRMLGR